MNEALEIIIALLKRFEGCQLTAYRCPAGIWTLGWGETLGVREGMVWTQQQADDRLRQRAGQFLLATLKRCPALHLAPPARVAACVSLTYNIGEGAFGASSVSRHTMRQAFADAANAFLLWNKVAGRVLRGLTLRRQIERGEYLRHA